MFGWCQIPSFGKSLVRSCVASPLIFLVSLTHTFSYIKSVILHLKIRVNNFNVFIDGRLFPVSHFVTVVLDTCSLSATCFWVSPLFFLTLLSFSIFISLFSLNASHASRHVAIHKRSYLMSHILLCTSDGVSHNILVTLAPSHHHSGFCIKFIGEFSSHVYYTQLLLTCQLKFTPLQVNLIHI